MTIKHDYRQHDDRLTAFERGQTVLAAAGVLGGLAASSCCILPLVLFSLGVSGAWLGNLTQLAPYQPYFIAATIACVAGGYWLHRRSSNVECFDGTCARSMPNRLVKLGLVLATGLIVAAVGFNAVAPLFLDS
ncbi:MAG TPA: mercuric transporter MerT family protein [Xanthobacteraceae bacterium]|nr:mercuric transporter MerT family protein [Xanthobacteraceae bacterium]